VHEVVQREGLEGEVQRGGARRRYAGAGAASLGVVTDDTADPARMITTISTIIVMPLRIESLPFVIVLSP